MKLLLLEFVFYFLLVCSNILGLKGNEIVKDNILEQNWKKVSNVDPIEHFKRCLFGQARQMVKQLLLDIPHNNEKNPKYFQAFPHHPEAENVKRGKRQTMLGVENPEINWNRCVLKSELQAHRILEQEHMLAIKEEMEKLHDLIRLLQDQQYILNMMGHFKDTANSNDVGEQNHLKKLLSIIKDNSQREGKSFVEHENLLPDKRIKTGKRIEVGIKPKPITNLTSIIEDLNKIKILIKNLQNDKNADELRQQIEIQRGELNKLKEAIQKLQGIPMTSLEPTTQNIKMRIPEEVDEMQTIQEELSNLEHTLSGMMEHNSRSINDNDLTSNILGATLTKLKLNSNDHRNPDIVSRKAGSAIDDGNIDTLLNILNDENSKMLVNTENKKMLRKTKIESNKKSFDSNPKVRAENDDILDDFQKLFDNSDSLDGSNTDQGVNISDDLENKLSNLQKQLEISAKLKKLEKKINQMHSSESKTNDDGNEDINKKIAKIEKQLEKLNKGEGKDLSNEESIAKQLKNLQSDISKLKPKKLNNNNDNDVETSQGKDAASALKTVLNKLFGSKKPSTTKPSSSNQFQLTPAQIQTLKNKIAALKQGGGSSHVSADTSSAILPHIEPNYGSYFVNLNGNPNQAAYYKSSYDPYSTGFGKSYNQNDLYGKSYKPVDGKSNYMDAFYGLINSQYVPTAHKPYGPMGEYYGYGGYGLDKNQYGKIMFPYGYEFQSSPGYYKTATAPYPLRNIFGNGLYTSFNAPFGSPYIPYGSIPSLSENGKGSHYVNDQYKSNPYTYVNYNIPNVYGNKYPFDYTNSAYKSVNYPYTNKGQYKTQNSDSQQQDYDVKKVNYLIDNSKPNGINYNNEIYRKTINSQQYNANLPNSVHTDNSYSENGSKYGQDSVLYNKPDSIYKPKPSGGNTYKSQVNEPQLHINNFLENFSFQNQGRKPQFFPPYESKYQTNLANYEPSAGINTQDSKQSYPYTQYDSAADNSYSEQKITELKGQIYGLQNIINNLNRPEYLQKPEDKETVYKLNKKISDLKSVVSHLSEGVPFANVGTKSEHRQSDSDTTTDLPSDLESFLNSRRRKRETNIIQKLKTADSKPPDFSTAEILRQLGDVVNIIKYFKEELQKSGAELKNNSHTKENALFKLNTKRSIPRYGGLTINESTPNRSSSLNYFLDKLNNIMEVVSYFTQNDLSNKNVSSDYDHNDIINSNYSHDIKKRQADQEESSMRDSVAKTSVYDLLKYVIAVIDRVSHLENTIIKNSCVGSNNKQCFHKDSDKEETIYKRIKRQINENGAVRDKEVDNEADKKAKILFQKMSTLLDDIDDTNPNDNVDAQLTKQNNLIIEKQSNLPENHKKLQEKLEELKKQLDTKLQSNLNHRNQLPITGEIPNLPTYNTNIRASSHTNPYYSMPYYTPQSYYPVYYQMPQNYPQQQSHEKEDKLEKIKEKLDSKKKSIKEEAFLKIVDKIMDKAEIATPRVIERLFGLDKLLHYAKDDYGYVQDGYGYDKDLYALQQNFKHMGFLGYIPLIILRLLSNLTSFVKVLQKNKFVKTFLVPALVTVSSAGLVVFLIWWLSGDSHYDYYDNKGISYSEDYGGSYRSSNLDSNLYKQNEYEKRNNGLVRESDIMNNPFLVKLAQAIVNQKNSNRDYHHHFYNDDGNR